MKGIIIQRRVKDVPNEYQKPQAYARMAKATAPATKAPKALLELAAPVNSAGADVTAEEAGLYWLGIEAG